jgi:hypothetical protein
MALEEHNNERYYTREQRTGGGMVIYHLAFQVINCTHRHRPDSIYIYVCVCVCVCVYEPNRQISQVLANSFKSARAGLIHIIIT